MTLFKWSSISNAKTAVLMARQCREREQSHPALAQGSPEAATATDEHWAFASSSIVSSVMFMEANINEVFLSASMALSDETRPNFVGDGFPYVGGLLSRDDRGKLEDTWDLVEGAGLLDKYQFVLALLGKERMDKGNAPYQPANALVGVRNKLIHFKEGPHEVGSELRTFERNLRSFLGGTHFQPHPFTSAGNPLFPDQLFGYAGCRWAWRTADAFAQEFHKRLGIEAAYQPFRSTLTLA
ncbi:hypothetical protein [Arthrobacter sp. NPDC058127]|uniref:hypothetical protein n=1 Tax=Arthrobacter sp. NPDC058127 TaxID=3346351 RepID=UPI0036E750ED